MRRILVPYDGSKPAFRALEYAASRIHRGENLLVEILLVQPVVGENAADAAVAAKNWQKDEREAILSNPAFAKLAKGVKAKITNKFGDPAELIVEFVRKKHCREVVMGTSGMGRLKGFLMGSVAAKVAQLAKVPVTFVK